MTDITRTTRRGAMTHATESSTLADILERVLDKGIVIAGDIKVKLVDIELLTIQVRLVVCSVDRAMDMGMDWWARDPNLVGRDRAAALPEAAATQAPLAAGAPAALPEGEERTVAETMAEMAERLARLEEKLGRPSGSK